MFQTYFNLIETQYLDQPNDILYEKNKQVI